MGGLGGLWGLPVPIPALTAHRDAEPGAALPHGPPLGAHLAAVIPRVGDPHGGHQELRGPLRAPHQLPVPVEAVPEGGWGPQGAGGAEAAEIEGGPLGELGGTLQHRHREELWEGDGLSLIHI